MALTIPAMAEETGGRIVKIDRDQAALTLEDGSVYLLPEDFDYAAVETGMEVYFIYAESDVA
ncbi:DUF1344 domain-containing protein [Consotaella salsifontis]|uniref:DUF1344 domain-containing protein n=1 Tax=Consotaella salsifontis TaxID=1365950 RepID=UPI001FDA2B07|nr:DUF1344 domain-containing protein [Consotaella salsifontis]